jgi:cytoskeletal protein RodZ
MEERPSIGEALRQGREDRGLSVEEAALQSRVPLRLLQALESDDYRLLPDPLYLIRFLHDYARFLALDPEALETEFQRAVRRPTKVPLAPTSTVPAPPVVPWKQLAWTAGALVFVVPIVFIVLSLASKRAAERPPAAPQEQTTEQVAQAPQPPDAPVSPATPAPPGPLAAPEAAPEAAPGAPPASGAPLPSVGDPPAAPVAPAGTPAAGRQVLVAQAHELTWMVIKADRSEPREVLLQAGETARFTADTRFLVTLGNAGGVALSLNGVSVPPLGKSGEVVRDFALPQTAATGEAAAAPRGGSER